MSLSETRKLLQQSRKVVEEADENTSVTSILNMILNLVSSIDKRIQSVEKCDEIKNIIVLRTGPHSLQLRFCFSHKRFLNYQTSFLRPGYHFQLP
jgi:hypothetical protein